MPASREHWLAERARDVTSTESPALFDLSEYYTRFELWHIKSGTLAEAAFMTNERMRWGQLLEDAIAAGVAEQCGMAVSKQPAYRRLADARMGASYDYDAVSIGPECADERIKRLFGEHGPGNLEIKNVDKFVAKDRWAEDGLPDRIEIQVQHQMQVSGAPWTIVAGLAGGNDLMLRIRMRDAGVGDALQGQIMDFWDSITKGNEPPPVYPRDTDTLARVYGQATTGNPYTGDAAELGGLCAVYKAAAADEKKAYELKQEAKGRILHIIKDCDKAVLRDYKISAGTTAEVVVEAYVREAFRNVRITEIKR